MTTRTVAGILLAIFLLVLSQAAFPASAPKSQVLTPAESRLADIEAKLQIIDKNVDELSHSTRSTARRLKQARNLIVSLVLVATGFLLALLLAVSRISHRLKHTTLHGVHDAYPAELIRLRRALQGMNNELRDIIEARSDRLLMAEALLKRVDDKLQSVDAAIAAASGTTAKQ